MIAAANGRLFCGGTPIFRSSCGKLPIVADWDPIPALFLEGSDLPR